MLKKDQTTSTHVEAGLLFRPAEPSQGGASSGPRPHASYNIYVEEPGSRAGNLYENLPAEAGRALQQSHPSSTLLLPEQLLSLVVRVVQAPELLSACKAATFPRKGGEYEAHPEASSRDEPRALETPPPSQEDRKSVV